MRRSSLALCAMGLSSFVLVSSGCTELYVLFGPGGPWGPGGSGTAGTGTTASSQPATVIPGPTFNVRQLDPELESTAGAKVIVAADMDGDGLTDFVSGSDENQPIQVHLSNGGNAEFDTLSIAGGGPISRMTNLKIADFDGDGNPDVAVLVNDTGFVPVMGASLRGAVVLLFAPDDPADALAWTEVTISATFILPCDGEGLVDFDVADVDGVNGPDVVLASNEVGDVQKHLLFYPNPGGANARNGGAWNQITLTADAVSVKTVQLGDIDLDGDLDLVSTFPTAKTFNTRWLLNPLNEAGLAATLAGNWQPFLVGQQQDGADFLDLGDIDNDGDLDVAVAKVGEGLVQWFENPGAAFVSQQGFPWRVFNIGKLQAAVVINQVQLVDLNLDGQLDVYITASGNMVGMQPGTELQDFWLAFSILATNPVADIGRTAFADANNDGLLDIAAPFNRDGLTLDQLMLFTRTSP